MEKAPFFKLGLLALAITIGGSIALASCYEDNIVNITLPADSVGTEDPCHHHHDRKKKHRGHHHDHGLECSDSTPPER